MTLVFLAARSVAIGSATGMIGLVALTLALTTAPAMIAGTRRGARLFERGPAA